MQRLIAVYLPLNKTLNLKEAVGTEIILRRDSNKNF
jgi:hypothetical protein